MVLSHLHGIILQRYHVNLPLFWNLGIQIFEGSTFTSRKKKGTWEPSVLWKCPKLKVTQIRVASCKQVILAVLGEQTAPLNLLTTKNRP